MFYITKAIAEESNSLLIQVPRALIHYTVCFAIYKDCHCIQVGKFLLCRCGMEIKKDGCTNKNKVSYVIPQKNPGLLMQWRIQDGVFVRFKQSSFIFTVI